MQENFDLEAKFMSIVGTFANPGIVLFSVDLNGGQQIKDKSKKIEIVLYRPG